MDFLILFSLITGLLTMGVAASKGRPALRWFILGVALNLIGLLIALMASPVPPSRR